MARAPAEEPKKIPNDKKTAFQQHLAIHILIEQQMTVLKNRAAANIKKAVENGIAGKKIGKMHKMSKLPPSEILKGYAEEFEQLKWQGINVVQQGNLFGGVDVQKPKVGPDYYSLGLFAALEGKEGNPPKNLKGPDQQRWLEGWNDGVAARVFGQDYLSNAEAILRGANEDAANANAPADDGQTDLEDAVDLAIARTSKESDGLIIRVGLSDFGPEAVLADLGIEDLDLKPEQEEMATLIEIVDADGRRNVLKSKDGPTGLQDPLGADARDQAADEFEASADERAAQKARPSTVAATDPAPE